MGYGQSTVRRGRGSARRLVQSEPIGRLFARFSLVRFDDGGQNRASSTAMGRRRFRFDICLFVRIGAVGAVGPPEGMIPVRTKAGFQVMQSAEGEIAGLVQVRGEILRRQVGHDLGIYYVA